MVERAWVSPESAKLYLGHLLRSARLWVVMGWPENGDDLDSILLRTKPSSCED